MPVIPSQRQLIDTNVEMPQYNVAQAGIVGQAVEQFGAKVAAESLGIYEQIKQDQSKNEADLKSLDTEKKLEDTYQRLKLRSPDGLVRDEQGFLLKRGSVGQEKNVTFEQEFSRIAKEELEVSRRDMSGSFAKDLYDQKAGRYAENQMRKATIDTLELGANAYNRTNDEYAARIENSLANNINVDFTHSAINLYKERIMGGVGKHYDLNEAQKRVLLFEQKASNIYMKSLENEVLNQSNPSAAVAMAQRYEKILREEYIEPHEKVRQQMGSKMAIEMLTGDQRAAWLERFQNMQKIKKAEYSSAEYNAANKLLTQRTLDPDANVTKQDLASYWTNLHSDALNIGERPLAEVVPNFVEQVSNDYMTKQAGAAYNILPTEKLMAIAEGGKDKVIMSAAEIILSTDPQIAQKPWFKESMESARLAYSKDRKAQIEKLDAERKSDYVSFVVNSNPQLKKILGSVNITDAASVNKNAANIQNMVRSAKASENVTFPNTDQYWKPNMKEWGAQISTWMEQNKGSPDAITNLFGAYKKAWGSSFPAFIGDLITNHKAPEEFALLMVSQNSWQDRNILSAGMSTKAREQIGDKYKDVESEYHKQASNYVQASIQANFYSAEQADIRKGMMNVLTNIASKEVALGKTPPVAMKSAVVRMFGENHVIETKGGLFKFNDNDNTSKQLTILPKQIGNKSYSEADADAFKAFINDKTNEDGLISLGMQADIRKGLDKTRAYKQMAQMGSFVLSKDKQYIVFKFRLRPDGETETDTATAKDYKGKVWMMPVDEAIKRAGKIVPKLQKIMKTVSEASESLVK